MSLFQTCFFSFSRLMLWLKDWVLNHRFMGVIFCRGISDFSENLWFLLWWERRGNILIEYFFYFFIFYNWVARVNSEYQLSHLSLTDSRPSLGINLYLVSDSFQPASRQIRLGWFFEPWVLFIWFKENRSLMN